jgi:SAM-dependent methyltransferase
MIDQLARKDAALRGRVVLADATTTELAGEQFDAILAPYSFLQCLPANGVRPVLENVRRWLKPGGTFYTDTFSPYLIPFTAKGLEASERTFSDGTRISIYISYDHLVHRMTEYALVERTGHADCVLEMHLQYYFPGQLLALLVEAGFATPRVQGGFAGERFEPGANEVLVYEARRPATSGCSVCD